MRSKAPLALMEQMVMLLVFALAAALCLQAFTKSDALSARCEARDRAAALTQSAAETVRHCGGEPEEALREAAELLGYQYEKEVLWADYDAEWEPCSAGIYHLTVRTVPSGVPGLNQVRAAVETEEEVLFELEAGWQEEAGAHEG